MICLDATRSCPVGASFTNVDLQTGVDGRLPAHRPACYLSSGSGNAHRKTQHGDRGGVLQGGLVAIGSREAARAAVIGLAHAVCAGAPGGRRTGRAEDCNPADPLLLDGESREGFMDP